MTFKEIVRCGYSSQSFLPRNLGLIQQEKPGDVSSVSEGNITEYPHRTISVSQMTYRVAKTLRMPLTWFFSVIFPFFLLYFLFPCYISLFLLYFLCLHTGLRFLFASVPILVACFPIFFWNGTIFHTFFWRSDKVFSTFSRFVHPIFPVFFEIGRLPLTFWDRT